MHVIYLTLEGVLLIDLKRTNLTISLKIVVRRQFVLFHESFLSKYCSFLTFYC